MGVLEDKGESVMQFDYILVSWASFFVGKRWLLVHLPMILIARKRNKAHYNVEKSSKIFKSKIHSH